MPEFKRVIGIDYSGAETAYSSLKGLWVYMADGGAAPREVTHRPRRSDNGRGAGSRNCWSKGLLRTSRQSPEAKSVFYFDVQEFVAKSMHAGIPWLQFIRGTLGEQVHFWPFDGLDMPVGKSVVVEVYPPLWSAGHPVEDRTPGQHDAYSLAA